MATYNLHDCRGTDGRYDPVRTAAVLDELDADLIAVQEITLDSAGELVAALQQATGLQLLEATVLPRGNGRYGNALLTRVAVSASRRHDISQARAREPRGALSVSLKTEGRVLNLLATHLGLQAAERRRQIRHLAGLAEREACALLLGDFNVWGWPAVLRPLTSMGFRGRPVRSFPTRPYPLLSLDRILFRGPVSIRRIWRHVSVRSRSASDHYPIVADLDICD